MLHRLHVHHASHDIYLVLSSVTGWHKHMLAMLAYCCRECSCDLMVPAIEY